MADPGRHIALAFANFGVGGAQRAMLTLAIEFRHMGWTVDLLVFDAQPRAYPVPEDGALRVFTLSRSLPRQLGAIAHWARTNPGVAVLATQENVTRVFGLARRFGRLDSPLIIREANRVRMNKPTGQTRLWAPFMPWLYRAAAGYITLSHAARDDLAALVGTAPEPMPLIPNALDQAVIQARGQEPLDHPWFGPERSCPVVLGVGRLVDQKGFETLIDAVAALRRTRRVRLVILGEGQLGPSLSARAEAVGLGKDFALPGFQDNPFAFMARADLFVLSSRWEGSPNALLEAMATGAPVVACDCPSGPREVLISPDLGQLVPVDDVPELTEAISRTLDQPGDPDLRIAHIRTNHGVKDWALAYERAILEVIR